MLIIAQQLSVKKQTNVVKLHHFKKTNNADNHNMYLATVTEKCI